MDLSQVAMPWVVALFCAGFLFLFGGGHFLVDGSSLLARILGISPIVIGLTVVALGTSMPEFLVSMTAALKGQTDVALGNIIGSNVSNIGLILGVSALARPIAINAKLLKFDIPVVGASTLVFWLLCSNGLLGRLDGLVLFLGFLLYIFWVVRTARRDARDDDTREKQASQGTARIVRSVGFILLGFVGLKLGAEWVVDSATEISYRLGVPELILGLTVVALGTSLPELATSVVAALKREGDISIGNIIGSNLFNLMAIAGPTAMVKPLTVAPELNYNHLPILCGLTLFMFPLLKSGKKLTRAEGGVLMSLYFAIMLWWVFWPGGV